MAFANEEKILQELIPKYSVLHFDACHLWGAMTLLAVFDGHGKMGEVVSQVATNVLCKLLLENLHKAFGDEAGPEDFDKAERFVNKAAALGGTESKLTELTQNIKRGRTSGDRIRAVLAARGDPYGILDVSPAAKAAEVKRAYHKTLLLVHPDKTQCKNAREAFDLAAAAQALLLDE